jgi:signal transduction histidine kinase/CheY-like chemotaxis protein
VLLSFAAAGASAARAPAPQAVAAPSIDRASMARFDAEIASAKSSMLVDPELGLRHAVLATQLATRFPASTARQVALATAHWLQGESLMRLNRPADADRIVSPALREAARYVPGTKLHGDLLQADGWVSVRLGRVQRALEAFQSAHKIYGSIGEPRGQAKALMNIGSIYNDAGDYERALQYHAQAAEVFAGDPNIDVATHNNRGNALRELGRFRAAEAEYRQALTAAEKLDSPLLAARILTNIAAAQELSGQLTQAETSADRGLQITRSPSAADWRPFLWGVKAQIAFKRGDRAAAADYIGRTFQGVDLAHTAMPYREFHDFARTLYESIGDDPLALAHLKAFKRLDDESRQVAASTNAALMAAQFDFANQDLRIAKLKTGQLERDVELAKSRARMHLIVTYGIGGASLVIFLLLLIGYIRNRAANLRLSKANAALEKALKAKTEFLATTSHEIRTPLNGILGMTQVILHDPAVAGQLRERIQVVHGAGETMKVLVDDILDVAKMETGQIVIDRTEMELRHVLTDAVRLWDGQARAKGLALELDMAGCPGRILEDETRLRQILFNLLSNAIKFTEAGSVRLAVDTVLAPAGEQLRIQVVDTGIGIPDAEHERIFEAFHQVDGGTTRKFGGTGLGLAICRNLSAAMGGDIRVESVAGQGSTFIVTLPLVRAASAAVDLRDDAAPRGLAATRMLVIERNPLAQSILRATIEGEVASLEIVDGGEQAIETLGERSFDAIVAEGASIALPSLDPFESVAAIVAAAPGATVTMLWSGLTDADRDRLAECGAARILAKPIAARALLEALKTDPPPLGKAVAPGSCGTGRKSAA